MTDDLTATLRHDGGDECAIGPGAPASRTPPNRRPLTVGMVILPHFTLLPFAGFVDVMRLAADEGDRSRKVTCRWTVMTSDSQPVAASCGTEVRPDAGLSDPSSFDYIVLFGGLIHEGVPVDPALDDFLRDAAQADVPLIGVCTGVFTLIRLGLMTGRRCCVSWYHYWDLVRAFPDVSPVADQLYVVDGDRITCAGGTGAIDLAAWLIERHIGRSSAQKAIQILIADQARPAEAPQPHVVFGTDVSDPRLRRALTLMEQSIAQPWPVSKLSAALGLSRRQLERLFRAELGVSPSQCQRSLRLHQGHWMLTHTDRPITDIAFACGFADGSHFARQMKATYGTAPQIVRSRARNNTG